jgi:hypothetical protein
MLILMTTTFFLAWKERIQHFAAAFFIMAKLRRLQFGSISPIYALGCASDPARYWELCTKSLEI